MTDRILDKLDDLLKAVVKLDAETEGINARLDKLNGSVARHENSINDLKTDAAVDDQLHQTVLKRLEELGDKVKIDSQTFLKISVIGSVTLIAIFKEGSTVLDALLTLVK